MIYLIFEQLVIIFFILNLWGNLQDNFTSFVFEIFHTFSRAWGGEFLVVVRFISNVWINEIIYCHCFLRKIRMMINFKFESCLKGFSRGINKMKSINCC